MKNLYLICLASLLLSISSNSYSWGRDGHTIVGRIAIDKVTQETRDWLAQVIGDTSNKTLRYACNWPDIVRDQDQYSPTRPFHYVNLPRGASEYRPQRDCADGRCVTEKIKYFAARLDQEALTTSERSKAFNWLCHLVGDLHQPLHTGFADDRGGNDVTVNFHGSSMRLHQLWDTGIIRHRHNNWQKFTRELQALQSPNQRHNEHWNLQEVTAWTNESHHLVIGDKVYPSTSRINKKFEHEADRLIQQRLIVAGSRLAKILTAISTGQVALPARTQN